MERFEDNIQGVENNIPLTLEDVAGILDVDVNTVIHLSNLRILKGFRVGPRSDRRFLKEDVDKFLRV